MSYDTEISADPNSNKNTPFIDDIDVEGEGNPPAEIGYITEMHRIASEALNLHDDSVHWLILLFHGPFYRRHLGSDSIAMDNNQEELFQHFVTKGIHENYAPGPFFNPAYCADMLTEMGVVPGESILLSWLQTDMSTRGVPTPLFDARYYLSRYPDIAEVALDPFVHFLMHGQKENRIPSEALTTLQPFIGTWGMRCTTWSDFLAIIPNGQEIILAQEKTLETLRSLFQLDFYRAQVGEGIDENNIFQHFMRVGLFDGLRPTLLFNENYYRRQLARRLETNGLTDLHRRSDKIKQEPLPLLDQIPEGVNAFLHWLLVGLPNRVIPTPLFDEERYRATNQDLRSWSRWLFEHYIYHGIQEIHRHASPVFNTDFYCRQRKDRTYKIPLLDFILVGEAEGAVPSPDVNYDLFTGPNDLKTTTRLERCATMLQDKIDRLNNPIFQSLIEHAVKIEPMILRPYGMREFQWPPFKHSSFGAVKMLSAIRKSVPHNHYESIVLIPHCRMAGSARVAGSLVRTLRALYPSDSLLLVLTELSEFQRPDWFVEDTQVFDLASYLVGCGAEVKIVALLDLVRGLKPKRVINVNSRLGWELAKTYGQQIATWTDFYAYLFTWDRDTHGNKGGYPIDWLYATFDSYSGIFVDNAFLIDEIAERHALSGKLREKIHLLHTPAEAPDYSYDQVFEERRRRGKRLRCFWAGRFDPQKRFDVVIEIARRMPDMEFLVWGKAVLGGTDIDFTCLPDNIKLQGVYENFDDLPIESCDFFLYTAQWDGLPTILVDVGARGIATVASRVGGTGDLISEATAWPVDNVLNPEAYMTAIRSMCADPTEVGRRAANFRMHTMKLCSGERYRATLDAALGGGSNG